MRTCVDVTSTDAGGRPGSTAAFRQSETHAGRCTAHGTIYTANIAAGLMAHQFTRWLRDIAVEPELTLNLPAGELTAR